MNPTVWSASVKVALAVLFVTLLLVRPSIAQPADESVEPEPGEPSRALLSERLTQLQEAMANADAETVWRLIDTHSREAIEELLTSLQQRVEPLNTAQRERIPPGWADGDTLGDVLELDAKGFLGVFLRSRDGREAAQRLGRIVEVERLLWPDRDRFWVLRLIEAARREWRRQSQGPAADEGRVINFTVRSDEQELGQVPTTAVYEDGRWRIRLFPAEQAAE